MDFSIIKVKNLVLISIISFIISLFLIPLYVIHKYWEDEAEIMRTKVILQSSEPISFKLFYRRLDNTDNRAIKIQGRDYYENVKEQLLSENIGFYSYIALTKINSSNPLKELKLKLIIRNNIYEKIISQDVLSQLNKREYIILFSSADLTKEFSLLPKIIFKLVDKIPVPINYSGDIYFIFYSISNFILIFIVTFIFLLSLKLLNLTIKREKSLIFNILILTSIMLNILPIYNLFKQNIIYEGGSLFVNMLYILHYSILVSIRLLQDLSITIILIKLIENLKFMFLRLPLGFALGYYIFLLIANNVVLLITKEELNYTLFSLFELKGVLNFVNQVVLILPFIFSIFMVIFILKLIKYKFNLFVLVAPILILVLTNTTFNTLISLSNITSYFYKYINPLIKSIFIKDYKASSYESIFYTSKIDEFTKNKSYLRSIVFSLLNEEEEIRETSKRLKSIESERDNIKELNKKYGLKLAEKRDYPKITNKKYNKILLFLLESLNLEYIKTYNENLKAQNSNRFFNSTKVIKNTFTNYYSAVRGTAWGILATLTSEPSFYIYNYLQKNENQKIETAIPFILQKNGFTNYYIAFSDIKYQKFDSMLSSLGFHYTFGSQHFIKNDAEVAEFSRIAKPEWAAAMPDILLYKKIYEFIKERKDEKYFLTSLNIDTHVPGRSEKDYYGLDKNIPDFKISNKYNEYGKSILRAVGILDFLFSEFLEKLESEGLFTDDMLIIITSDHSTPPLLLNLNYDEFDTKSDLNKIPLIFLSKSNEFAHFNKEVIGSQIDFASTLLHILDIEVPQVYFGESLFTDKKDLAILREFNKNFILKYKSGKEIILHRNSNSPLKELLNSIFLK